MILLFTALFYFTRPLKVAITNWRKDGTAFRNLLAIKPIMDQNGDYVSYKNLLSLALIIFTISAIFSNCVVK